MTLNPAIRNIASAYRLSLVNICVRFLRNPSRGSTVTERKDKKVIWPLTPRYDIDVESSNPEHCLCTSSQSGKHLCQVSSKSFKGFKSYRGEGKKRVIWPLTPKYDLDLESSNPEHCVCTSSQSGKHLCQVSSKSFKGFKSYRGEGKKSNMAFDL